MGAAAGKATVWTTRAEDRLAAAGLVIADHRRSSDGHSTSRRIWDALAACTDEALLAAVDDVVFLEEIHAFPPGSAARRRMEGALRAAMGCLMEEFLGLRVWDASQLEGRSGLRFAADKLSVSMEARSASSLASLASGSSSSTVRTATTGDLSFVTVDELYESQTGCSFRSFLPTQVEINGEPQVWSSVAPKSLSNPIVIERGIRKFPEELSLICPASLSVLHEISLRVIRAGYAKELLHAFSKAPCDVLDRFLSILQVGCCVEIEPVISYEDAEWWTAEDMIRRWILATNLVIKALVAMHRQLHAQSSGAFDRFKDEYLLAIAKRSTSVLLRFADGFTTTRSLEKLIYVLKMYEVLGSAVVDGLMVMFAGQHTAELISGQAQAILGKLARTLRAMIGDLVTKVRTGEGSKRMTKTHGIHPLTRYTMACVESLAPHRVALDAILATTSGQEAATEGVSSLRDLVSELTACLESNIEMLSGLCGGLRHLFLANNVSFVLKHAEDVLGDEWAARCRSRVEQHVRGYVESSWAPVVACLNGKHPAKALAKFSSSVEKAYGQQACCEVPDPALRAVLRKAAGEKVVGAYGAWLLKHPEHDISSAWHTVESLEGLLSELFEGGEGRSS